MSRQRHLLTAILAVILTVLVSGCKNDSSEEPSQTTLTVSKLQGTTWHYYKKVVHLSYDSEIIEHNEYLTFKADRYNNQSYQLQIKGFPSTTLFWFVRPNALSGEEELWTSDSADGTKLPTKICCISHKILKLTETELVLSGYEHEVYLRKVPYNEFSESD